MTFTELRDIALKGGELCDHCLGRIITHAFKGTDNDAIGAALRKAVKDADMESLVKEKQEAFLTDKCFICGGLFMKLGAMEARMLEKSAEWEWNTFLVGNKVPDGVVEREELLWTKTGAQYCEPIKRELNRVLGKRISLATEKEADFDNPNIVITANFKTMRAEALVMPLYIMGKYRKLVRGIPQTRWPCRACRGIGCERCKFTGKMYPESVEELVAYELLKETQGTGTKFHGKGREDIDALMLGSGRDFVIEIESPKRRGVDLKAMEEKINAHAAGKVSVTLASFSNKAQVVEVKAATPDKAYEAAVECQGVTDEDLKTIESSFPATLQQRTPRRVAHRRADLVRPKAVRSVRCTRTGANTFSAAITAQSGTYIKELIGGDDGRTKPSFSTIINKRCECKQLNVMGIGEEKA